MDAKYKTRKVDFVSNLSGGTLWEMNQVAIIAPISVFLWSVLQSRHRAFTPYSPEAFLIDFLLNCCAILYVTTIYSSYPTVLIILLLVPAVSIYLSSPAQTRAERPRVPSGLKHDGNVQSKSDQKVASKEQLSRDLPQKPFITTYRGCMMVITCAAILAVDFRVFPRRFAKVENWGTSLMDMGVGSFVFSAGVVSARAVLKEQMLGRRTPILRQLQASLWHSVPLLVLGAVRTYSVKGLDYAEHVTEYGVHWNFFFTLALLPLFVPLFNFLFRFIPSYAVLSLIVGVAYQMALDSTELMAYILTAARTDLLSQNREGVFSFFGYLAIFLAGHSTGMYVLPRQEVLPKGSTISLRLRTSVLARLIVWSLLWSTLFILATHYRAAGLKVSRRLANLPYVLWVASFNTAQIALFAVAEGLCFPNIYQPRASSKEEEQRRCKQATSRVLYAFNRHGLVVFLIANVLTGLVNLTIRTLDVRNLEAMGILTAYIAVIAAVAFALDYFR